MTYLVELNIIKIITINIYVHVYNAIQNERIRKRLSMVQTRFAILFKHIELTFCSIGLTNLHFYSHLTLFSFTIREILKI